MKIIKYLIQFIIICIFYVIFKIIGVKLSSFLGGKLFEIIGPIFRSKKIINNNIKKAFPDYNYEELEIGFNARYLLDIAGQIDGSNILFALEGSGSPALIADSDDSQATYVLMPMRV